MQVGEVYKIDVAALDDADTEHPHRKVRGHDRDVHAVTVLAINAHRICSVECECGAQWVFQDIGAVHDARWRAKPRQRETVPASRRGGYGRRTR